MLSHTELHLILKEMKTVYHFITITVLAILCICCSDDSNHYPIYKGGFDFGDDGLVHLIGPEAQTLTFIEEAWERNAPEDSVWNEITIWNNPEHEPAYPVAYDYDAETQTYHYDWCTFTVKKLDNKRRQFNMRLKENDTGHERGIFIQVRKTGLPNGAICSGKLYIEQEARDYTLSDSADDTATVK